MRLLERKPPHSSTTRQRNIGTFLSNRDGNPGCFTPDRYLHHHAHQIPYSTASHQLKHAQTRPEADIPETDLIPAKDGASAFGTSTQSSSATGYVSQFSPSAGLVHNHRHSSGAQRYSGQSRNPDAFGNGPVTAMTTPMTTQPSCAQIPPRHRIATSPNLIPSAARYRVNNPEALPLNPHNQPHIIPILPNHSSPFTTGNPETINKTRSQTAGHVSHFVIFKFPHRIFRWPSKLTSPDISVNGSETLHLTKRSEHRRGGFQTRPQRNESRRFCRGGKAKTPSPSGAVHNHRHSGESRRFSGRNVHPEGRCKGGSCGISPPCHRSQWLCKEPLRKANGTRKSEANFARDARGGRAARKDHFPDYPCNTYGNSPFTTTGNPETINNTRSQTVATR